MIGKESIIVASVEYKYNSNMPDRIIRPHGHIGKREIRTEELENDLADIIEHKIPARVEELYGITAKIKIKKIEYGSITLFFSVLLQGIQMIASYKDFRDSIRLIRDETSDLINRLMKNKYEEDFNVSVHIKSPNMDNGHYLEDLFFDHPKRFRGLNSFFSAHNYGSRSTGGRDAFFWFLLIMNIILLTALGVMVYGAVVKTYF